MQASLRADHSYPNFQKALSMAGKAAQVLALGCGGEGLSGLDHRYVREEWLTFDPEAKVTGLDLTPSLLEDPARWPQPNFDVIISNSLVLYIHSLEQYGTLLNQMLKPGGRYVLGKEVNARHFRNSEILTRTADWRKARLKTLSLRERLWAFRKRFAPPRDPLYENANRILAEKHGFQRKLGPQEFRALIEIHRPAEPPTDLQLGLCGFDVEELVSKVWPFLELAWVGTSGHLGYAPHSMLSEQWRAVDAELAARFPLDGAFLSACFVKKNPLS